MAFVPLEKLINLHEGYRQTFRLKQRWLLLIKQQERIYIIDNQCPHQRKPLHQGTLKGSILRCPFHGFAFDLALNGRCLEASCPALTLYPVCYQGLHVGINL